MSKEQIDKIFFIFKNIKIPDASRMCLFLIQVLDIKYFGIK